MNALWKPKTEEPKHDETVGQRALRAAEAMNAPAGIGKTRRALRGDDVSTLVTREEAAAMFGVRTTAVSDARYLLTHGSPEEIEWVRSGRTLDPVVKAIRLRKPETRRSSATPEAKEKRMLTGVVWGQLRGSLEGLAKLPSAQDCVKLFAQRQAAIEFIDKQLPKAVNWLREFEEEWRKRNE